MKHNLILFAAIALLASSCASRHDTVPTKEYYSGEFIYLADAATVKLCATGERLPISHDGDYLTAERRYSSLGTHGEPVFIEFYGRRVAQPAMEGDGTETVLVIDSMIGFDQTVACNPDAVVVGVYESNTDHGKYLLRLKADYSYTQSLFVQDKQEQTFAGRWYMCAGEILVLSQSTPKVESSTFSLFSDRGSLVKNSGGKPLVFTKVYL